MYFNKNFYKKYLNPFLSQTENLKNQNPEVLFYVAEILKNKGNIAYQDDENIQKAIDYYLNGIAVFRYYSEEKNEIIKENELTFENETQKKEIKSLINFLFLNLSQSYLKTKEYELALITADEALKLNEKNAKAYFRKAKAFEGINTIESIKAAIDCFRNVIKYVSPIDNDFFKKVFNKYNLILEEKKKEMEEKNRTFAIQKNPFLIDSNLMAKFNVY